MLLAVVMAFVLPSCATSRPPLFENIHTVVPGELYRSAQLTPERLGEVLGQEHIKSVLNLRGAYPGEQWYDAELAAAKKAGVEHVSFELSSRAELDSAQSQQLLELMRQAPKPLLVHCWAGADRTGLATALYLYEVHGYAPERASQALSVRYFHLSMTSAGAMDRSFQTFVDSRTRAASGLAPAVE